MVHLSEKLFDHIVVGSGPSGAMCAQTLLNAGKTVLLIDGANVHENEYGSPSPGATFDDIRTAVEDQHQMFLGRNFESIEWGAVRAGSQLTPARKYILQKVEQWMPIRSDNFEALECLAFGGLGTVWGLGCCMFSAPELEMTGLPVSAMLDAYQVVANRIGVSYNADDIEPFTMPGLKGLQPAIDIDDNARTLLHNYKRQSDRFKKNHLFMGVPALALLTAGKDRRSANDYANMDFYSNRGQSAYRPDITIKELGYTSRFSYLPGAFATRFVEEGDGVSLDIRLTDTRESLSLKCRKLMLAGGSLGTARIVLRSFGRPDAQLPLLCNPYSYLTCLQWERLGKVPGVRRTSLAQLSFFYDREENNTDVAMASIYSYSSLLMYRVIRETPLNFRDGISIMRYILPATIIAGIHHPDQFSGQKYVQLKPDDNAITGDHLAINYQLSEDEKRKADARERLFTKAFRQLKCVPLKKVRPPFGASAHYAGTLPFSRAGEPFTTQPDGRLAATKNIFIADGSSLAYLPAKGLTFTLMANAYRVALNSLITTA